MNKKIIIAAMAVTMGAGVCMAHHGGFRCGPRPHWGGHHYHHHHGGWWGRGGCHFWPGFVGGVVGGAVYSSLARPYYTDTVVVQQPTVVTQPVVVQQPTVVATQPAVVTAPVVTQPQTVWVPGAYVDQVQPNGSVMKVWQPGHYEQR